MPINNLHPRINGERLNQSLVKLSQIGALAEGGVCRLALTDADRRGRDQLVSWMKDLQMAIHIDEVGNIFGIRLGESDLPPVMLGSHIDTVTVAGRYDGCYGVLAALECVHTLNDNNVKTRRSVAVAAFTNEEGVRYQPGMLGSAAYRGSLPVEKARDIQGIDGSRFGDELEKIGYAGTMKCGEIQPYAYLELHIEQGPSLDWEQIPLGVVDAVVGISWYDVTVIGVANHAGTTPMELRHDAGLSAARMINRIRQIAVSLGGNQKATCGMVAFYPNAINIIPGKATFTVDLRNDDDDALRKAEQQLAVIAREVEAEGGVTIQIHQLEHVPPVKFHPSVVSAIEESSEGLGIRHRRVISGAGHDAQLMAGICPAAMIFVPSQGGISHSPAEYTSPEALETGAKVLLRTLLSLANRNEELKLDVSWT